MVTLEIPIHNLNSLEAGRHEYKLVLKPTDSGISICLPNGHEIADLFVRTDLKNQNDFTLHFDVYYRECKVRENVALVPWERQ